jgi:hypothetical protein
MLSKTEPLNVKVLPEYKFALRALARLESESVSVIIRRLIRQEAQEHGVWPCVTETAVLAEELKQEIDDGAT